MNRERAKELLPIIQAYAEGREIQMRYVSKGADGNEYTEWEDRPNPIWYSDSDVEYRIKPERRKVWVHFPKGDAPGLREMRPD